jgi:hypothetical protein
LPPSRDPQGASPQRRSLRDEEDHESSTLRRSSSFGAATTPAPGRHVAFVLQRGSKAISGMRGPTGMYSWSTRFSFDNGIVSMTA